MPVSREPNNACFKKTNYWSFCKRSAIEQQPSYQYQTVKQ
jgi:hypothetical protein